MKGFSNKTDWGWLSKVRQSTTPPEQRHTLGPTDLESQREVHGKRSHRIFVEFDAA
jgi:hypothetical protein